MVDKTVQHQQRSVIVILDPVAGLPLATEIVTADGLLPVEHLTLGDRIVTREFGMQKLIWMGHQYVTCNAVRLLPGALGHDLPKDRMFLPAGQRVLVRDWRAQVLYDTQAAGVRARRLVDGEHIKNVGARNMRLFYLGFEQRSTIYANGIEMLSHEPSEMPKSHGRLRPKTQKHLQPNPAKDAG